SAFFPYTPLFRSRILVGTRCIYGEIHHITGTRVDITAHDDVSVWIFTTSLNSDNIDNPAVMWHPLFDIFGHKILLIEHVQTVVTVFRNRFKFFFDPTPGRAYTSGIGYRKIG